MRFDSYLIPSIKINSKQIIDLNAKPTTLKPLKKKKEESHYDVKVAKEFLHKHQKYNS